MDFIFRNIEASLNSAKQKYLTTGKISEEEFGLCQGADFTPNKKYLEFICKSYVAGDPDDLLSLDQTEYYKWKEHVRGLLLTYERSFQSKAITRAIDSFKSMEELEGVLFELRRGLERSFFNCLAFLKYGEDYEILKETEGWVFFQILSYKASEKLGDGCGWCLSTQETHYEGYRDRYVAIYFVINKEDPEHYRWCFLVPSSGPWVGSVAYGYKLGNVATEVSKFPSFDGVTYSFLLEHAYTRTEKGLREGFVNQDWKVLEDVFKGHGHYVLDCALWGLSSPIYNLFHGKPLVVGKRIRSYPTVVELYKISLIKPSSADFSLKTAPSLIEIREGFFYYVFPEDKSSLGCLSVCFKTGGEGLVKRDGKNRIFKNASVRYFGGDSSGVNLFFTDSKVYCSSFYAEWVSCGRQNDFEKCSFIGDHSDFKTEFAGFNNFRNCSFSSIVFDCVSQGRSSFRGRCHFKDVCFEVDYTFDDSYEDEDFVLFDGAFSPECEMKDCYIAIGEKMGVAGFKTKVDLFIKKAMSLDVFDGIKNAVKNGLFSKLDGKRGEPVYEEELTAFLKENAFGDYIDFKVNMGPSFLRY